MDKYQALRDAITKLDDVAQEYGWASDQGTRTRLARVETRYETAKSSVDTAIRSLLAERDGYLAQHNRDSIELRSLCSARDEARKERDSMRKTLQAIAEFDAPINVVDTMTGPERDMVGIARAALSLK